MITVLFQARKVAAAAFVVASASMYAQISESFETGLPTSYGTATSYQLNSGVWTGQANGIIRGTTGVKTGSYNLQIRSQTGAQATTPQLTGGVGTISFWASASTASNGLQVRVSRDGSTFQQIGSTISTLAINNAKQFSIVVNDPSIKYVQFYRTASTIYIDDVEISVAPAAAAPPTWDGTAWQNGTPSATTDAIIDGNYSGPAFTAKNLTVNSGKTLTVTSSITVENIVNNGSIALTDSGNLIQSTAGTYTGTGAFQMLRNTSSAESSYSFWSSPVAGQDMSAIFQKTPQYVMTYNTATDYYDVVTNAVAAPGVGYSIKLPALGSVATFSGKPLFGKRLCREQAP